MWLVLQGVYALVAWSIAVRAVARSAAISGALDAPVVEAARALRARGEGYAALSTEAMHPAIAWVLGAEADGELASDRADEMVSECAPPSRALRGMATIGTSLGLLGAIATLRGIVGGGGASAARAFESALLGFVTAIPLWTALAVAGQRMRRVSVQLHRLAEVVDGEPMVGASAGSEEPDGD